MKLRPFELTLVVIFGILLLGALLLLRTFEPKTKDGEVTLGGTVSVWGVLPPETIDSIIYDLGNTQPAYRDVTYRYIPPEEFDNRFVNALADGTGPDLVLLSHESLVRHRSRLEAVPYEFFPARDFRSLYIDGAEIFALGDGVYGYPIAADPLVLYWNRDLFSFSNLITAPATWEEVVSEIVPDLTVRDFNRTITQSGLAMGEYSNIKNAFPVLSLLLLQAGSVMVTEKPGGYELRLNETIGATGGYPLTTALTFYTNFNSVSNTLYSWNRSLPLDREAFLGEQLAMYFGFGSEAKELAARNPNLNFDIAEVPQGATVTVKRTYARFYGLMVPKAAANKGGAYMVRQELGSQLNAKKIADANNLAPVHRTLLLAGSNDVYGRVLYKTMPIARGWLSPAQSGADKVFTQMIDDVISNRSAVTSAANDAIVRLQREY